MTDLVGELRSRRLVMELDPVRRPGAGRPTRPITLDGDPWCVVGVHIDIDGVQFTAATVGGRELWQETVPAELCKLKGDPYPAFERLLLDQLDRIPAGSHLVAIQVGMPGYVARDRGTVRYAAELGWRDLPLAALISASLKKRGQTGVHIGIATDCHLAALHASRVELELPTDSVAVYFGGTRHVGSGVIVDGEIFIGANGGAGDFGHLNVDPNGPEDSCGRSGCLESFAGPVPLLVRGGLLDLDAARDLVAANPQEALERILAAAEDGDETMLGALHQAGLALGRAIDDILGTLNPQAVILGGFLGVLSPHLMDMLHAQIATRLQIGAFAPTQIVALPSIVPRVVRGATLAARDACLYDPLSLTTPLSA